MVFKPFIYIVLKLDIAHVLLDFEAGSTSYFLDCGHVGWPHLRNNAIDFYYRLYYVMLYLSNKTFKYNTLIMYVKLVFCVFLPILLPLCASTCHVSDAEHYIPPPF